MSARIWLTFVAMCQVFLTPLVAFSLTYLVKFDFSDDNVTNVLHKEMMPWIGTASLIYGMIALLLALILGASLRFQLLKREVGGSFSVSQGHQVVQLKGAHRESIFEIPMDRYLSWHTTVGWMVIQ